MKKRRRRRRKEEEGGEEVAETRVLTAHPWNMVAITAGD